MVSQKQLAERIFGAVLELESAERASFLHRTCGGDDELRRLVEELLRADESAGSFLERPICDLSVSSETTQMELPTSGGKNAVAIVALSRFAQGQIIAGRFTIERFIARGGMGEVYEAKDRLLQGAPVALKMIRPEIASDIDALRRFEQEVLLARKITHPNLCPIYEIFRCEDPAPAFLFLTMKLLQGETLERSLRKYWLISREEKIAIFDQMVRGIAAMHLQGVVHRDIKPNNVMLDRSGTSIGVSIMDFGLARLYDSEATVLKPGIVAGTPGYIAPELLRGHRPSQASDIFALGVLLHHVFTGERPVESNDGMTTIEASSLNAADIPARYIHAVREFLSSDPQRRCRAFEQAQAMANGSGIDLLPAPRPTPRLWTRRSFAIASAATVCTASAGAVWKREHIYNLLNPLPARRFVAILGWPPPFDAHIRPMLLGLIDAMANELARAEAFDHNFFVAAPRTPADMSDAAQLNEARESLGANLVLATSVKRVANDLHVHLQVLTPSGNPLRSRELRLPVDQQLSASEKVVHAAAGLLGLGSYQPDARRSKAGTDNPDALAAFQAAEALMKQPNNAGLEEAIDKYKEAVDLDNRYAVAHAKLAMAYLRLYVLHRDPASMMLARANAETSLSLDSRSVAGHVALASVYQDTGAEEDALREMAVALSLDPSNTGTMIYQADIYAGLGRWQEAEEIYKRTLRIRPNMWNGYLQLAVNYNAQGKYAEALQNFKIASMACPKSALILNDLGFMYFQLGDFEAATATLRKSTALAPNSDAASSLADVLRAQGKYKEALQASLDAVRLGPEESTNWLGLGDADSLLPHHGNDALKAYTRAAEIEEAQLRINPKDGPRWMQLALYRVKSGRPETALELVRMADSLGAADLSSQLYKVRILELLGKRQEAISLLSACTRKGATQWQLMAMHDLDKLRLNKRG